MLKLEKLNSHPRDSKIKFDEKPHIYYVNNKAYEISVTSFVHSFFEEFNAMKIINKFYDIWQSNSSSPYFGLTPDEIIQMWEDNGKNASHLGTLMHKDIELFYNGEVPQNEDSIEFKHFQNFHQDYNKLKPYRSEWIIFCEELRLAGSIDMAFIDENGELILFDWKRSKEIKEQNKYGEGKYPLNHLPDSNYWHYSLQLNIYKAILEKNYDKTISKMRLAIFHPNNDNYIIVEVPNLQEEVQQMFELRLEELK